MHHDSSLELFERKDLSLLDREKQRMSERQQEREGARESESESETLEGYNERERERMWL